MSPERTIELIGIFEAIEISTSDVTTSEERNEGRVALVVTIVFQGKSHKTKRLFYKDVRMDLPRALNPEELEQHFGDRVYWLDLDKHPWPQGKGESDLEGIVIPDIAENNDTSFIDLLRNLANNAQTGWIQEFTKDGQRGQYYHNLLNNNHWHDIILLIKAFIKSKGETIDEKYFSPLVFQWSGQEGDKKRTSLSKAFGGGRKMVDLLQENIKTAFKIPGTMKQFDAIIKLINYKPQIILQGPPGTGKTRLAKEIAEELCRQSQSVQIDKSFVLDHLYVGQEFSTPKER